VCFIFISLPFRMMIPPPPTSTLFPYTTLFRSHHDDLIPVPNDSENDYEIYHHILFLNALFFSAVFCVRIPKAFQHLLHVVGMSLTLLLLVGVFYIQIRANCVQCWLLDLLLCNQLPYGSPLSATNNSGSSP